MFEDDAEVLKNLSEQEVPSFFKFMSPEDPGLIGFGRFLILLTLWSVPTQQLPTMFFMNSGQNFKRSELRSEGITVNNLEFILTRHIKIREQGYDPNSMHSPTSILRYLFGPKLDRTLSFEELSAFHAQLRREVTKLQYFLLSDKSESASMSLLGFSRSVCALGELYGFSSFIFL